MRGKLLAFFVAFSVVALAACGGRPLGTLDETEIPKVLEKSDPRYLCASPSSCCAMRSTCLALDNDEAIKRYREPGEWLDTILRSVESSAWDASRVWVQIAPLFGPGIFGTREFAPIRLVERKRDGVKIAFITISPAQTLLLGWRLRNALDQVSQISPLWIDDDYYDARSRRWSNTMFMPRGSYEHSPENLALFRQETLSHYAYFADLFRPVEAGVEPNIPPDYGSDALCCCKKSQPLLERLVSLLLREKGRVATITEVVSTHGSELTKLVPDCTKGLPACWR